jgi:simple sugar transport system ATP-binding protein
VADVVLRAVDISKTYGRVVANSGVTLDVRRGEVHAVLGENGAGKSTLMRIFYGLEPPDRGRIEVRGLPLRLRTPSDAIRAGIGMVHQHFMLVGNMTVIENLIVGTSLAGNVLRVRAAKDRVRALAERFRMAIDLDKRISDLSVSEQQRVEILKALVRDATILILDEPTAVLAPSEIDEFMVTLRELAAEGFSILIVTHKLAEVMQVSSRVSVMRAGRLVGTWDTATTTSEILVKEMIGHGRVAAAVRRNGTKGEPILEMSDVHVSGDQGGEALRGLNLTVSAGEIVGIAGVEGNGQEELADTILGLRSVQTGSVLVGGADVTRASTVDILRLGVGFVPADRHRDGLILDFSVAENAVLVRHRERAFRSLGFLASDRMDAFAQRLIAEFSIKCSGPRAPSRGLSGGNQQKLILGRELAREPKLLVVVHPTRGLDIGAIDYVHSRLMQGRNAGMAILVVSTELEEIMTLSDRVAVLREGRIAGTVERSSASIDEVGRLMLGS